MSVNPKSVAVDRWISAFWFLSSALVFICVIIHWRSVCGAPRTSTPTTTCTDLKPITTILYNEAHQLLKLYEDVSTRSTYLAVALNQEMVKSNLEPSLNMKMSLWATLTCFTLFCLQKHYNGNVPHPEQIHKDAPDSTITGATTLEKLKDIYSKNEMFKLHLEQVREQDSDTWGGQLQGSLTQVQARLSHLDFKSLLPDGSLPPTPAPLTLSFNGNYDKKDYGRGVLVRLHQWVGNVLRVLEEICEMAPVWKQRFRVLTPDQVMLRLSHKKCSLLVIVPLFIHLPETKPNMWPVTQS